MNEEYIEYPADFNFGYDLTRAEDLYVELLPPVEDLPKAYIIDVEYLPPVGSQGQSPSCVAWASVYGATTYWAASKAGIAPSDPSNQASPAFIYIKVMQLRNEPTNTCTGSTISDYFPIITQSGGTPNLVTAPFTNGSPMGSGECSYLWKTYTNANPTIDSDFNVLKTIGVKTSDRTQIKQVLSMGYPVAYGTKLYDDFTNYRGPNLPIPYVGDGIIKQHNGKPAGHCMLIIGYDDNCGPNGAFLIQNSWTNTWGTGMTPSSNSAGFVWMDYETFSNLAQGFGAYIPD